MKIITTLNKSTSVSSIRKFFQDRFLLIFEFVTGYNSEKSNDVRKKMKCVRAIGKILEYVDVDSGFPKIFRLIF
jgi:hypothetical protein